ncbi:MAG TPA: FHA domain-containing protein [Pirellulales bacterium]|nr:FHA domain-containing protein [Pirellulales bacterium]
MEAKLVVVGGKANRSEVKLKLPAMLGRGRDVDVTVAHATVSRHHCLIYELDGALVVRDNGSLNGTVIDGKRIKEALLRPGQSLTIGPLTFRAEYEHNGSFPELGSPAPADTAEASTEEASGLPVINTSTRSRRGAERASPPPIAAKAIDEPKPATSAAPDSGAGGFDFLDDDEPADEASNEPNLNFLNETDDSVGESADSFDFLDDPASAAGKPKGPAPATGDSAEVFHLADEPAASAKKDDKAKARGKAAANGSAKPADERLGVNASAGEPAKRGKGDDAALDSFLNSLGLDE